MRSRTLDILRFVAVFLVLGRHVGPCPPNMPRPLELLLSAWRRGGWVGVDLFFVLSGFLIAGLLFTEHRGYGSISFKRFFVRRGFKIYPAFYALFATTLLVASLGHRDLAARGVVGELAFLQNYVGMLWWHTWSLAVEEHFYVLLPALLILLVRFSRRDRPFRSLPIVFTVLAAACLVLRILNARTPAFDYRANMFPSHLRFDSLFFGVLLSYVFHESPEFFRSISRRFRPLLLLLAVLLAAPAFVLDVETSFFLPTFGFTGLYVASGFLLWALLPLPEPGGPIARPCAFLGARSYVTYLWHAPVAAWGVGALSRLLPLGWGAVTLSYVVGSFLAGCLTYELIERRFLRVRDRLYPSRSGPSAPPAHDGANGA